MRPNRRELIVLAGGVLLGGCAGRESAGGLLAASMRGPIDAGPLSDYPADGVYGRFRSAYGFFVIREGPRVFAQSAICTHRACLLGQARDGFRCPCHGSTFTVDGHVTRGPARRNLPRFSVGRSADDHFIVHTDRPLPADQTDLPESSVLVG